MSTRFPKDFVWGAATASYQIEGAAHEDGRGESIWDRFCKTPGNVSNGDTGDVACDHYHRYEEDINIMKDMNLAAYRFSIAWPRIFPSGAGQPNQKGLDFYKRLLDSLAKQGITPYATMYHWDLPQQLEEKGGWVNRDTAKYFRDYAYYLLENLGDRVKHWITLNEPWCSAFLGYGNGHHAPGLKDMAKTVKAGHNLLYAHGLTVQCFREMKLAGQIGITLNFTPQHAASDSQEDQDVRELADAFSNRWFLDPIFKGRYPEILLDFFGNQGWSLDDQPNDLAIISSSIDFLGVNYYTRAVVGKGEEGYHGVKHYPPERAVTAMGWEIYPEGLYELLCWLQKECNNTPLLVTENGAAFHDEVVNGKVNDVKRTEYLRSHFQQAARAIQDGVSLNGYFVWSLLDNFEWAFGYDRRFGIVYVDYETQERIVKESGKWYSRFLAGDETL